MTKTTFMHYRSVDAQGRILGHGGATLAIREIEPGKLVVTTAMCNDNDMFCKKLGRTISGGRLEKFLADPERGIRATVLVMPAGETMIKNFVHQEIGQDLNMLGLE